MKNKTLKIVVAATCCTMLASSCAQQPGSEKTELSTVGNPYLPMWEHIPDGEPYVFEDPDQPGKQRVYIYGSHDSRITDYCGRELVVWSASTDSLSNWRYDGVILVVDKDANGKPGEELYRLENQRPQWQDQIYRFSYYKFNKTVALAGAFYIGIEQRSDDLINIGFDTSIDNIEYNFINTNGSWQQSSKHGSLMIRPVVGASYFIGVQEQSENTLQLYPNPVNDLLHIEGPIENGQVSIYDLTGRKVYTGHYQTVIPVDHLTDGIYLLNVTTNEGQVMNQKFIIRK